MYKYVFGQQLFMTFLFIIELLIYKCMQEEGEQQQQQQQEMLGDVGLVVGDLVFVVCLNFEPWPGKIKRINFKGEQRIYNVDFYNHDTYVNQPPQNLQIISDLSTIQKYREQSQQYKNKKIRSDVLRAIDMVEVQFQRRQLIMSEEPKLWLNKTPSLEQIKRQKNLLTMEIRRPIFKPKAKWVKKEEMQEIKKKKEEYQNWLSLRKRKKVPEVKKEEKVDEGKKIQKKSRRQKSKSPEKEENEPVSLRLKEKKKLKFDSALAKVVKQQEIKKEPQTIKSKSKGKKREIVKVQQKIKIQEKMKDEHQEIQKSSSIRQNEEKNELEKQKMEAEQIQKEEIAPNEEQIRMIPEDKKEEEDPIKKQQQEDNKKAKIKQKQKRLKQLEKRKGWKGQKYYDRQIQKLQEIAAKQYPPNTPMKINKFNPENDEIQKYRKLTKTKNELLVDKFNVSENDDDDVVKEEEEIQKSRQNCYISNHRPVGRFPRQNISPFENLSTQIVVEEKEWINMDERPAVDIWAQAIQFSKQQEALKGSKNEQYDPIDREEEDPIVKQQYEPAFPQ